MKMLYKTYEKRDTLDIKLDFSLSFLIYFKRRYKEEVIPG